MKKLKGMFLVVLFVILLPGQKTVYAKENFKTTIVSEESIKVSFPESCYVLKQNVSSDDPYLTLIGASKDYVEEYYKENNIFLHAVASDQSYEIVCTVKENENQQYLTDLSLVSDDEILTLANSMANTYESYGYTEVSSNVYTTANEKFAVIDFKTTDGDSTVSCKQFYTILNDKAYYFTLRVFLDEIPAEDIEIMNEVVSSIVFYKTISTSATIYENEEYGIYFEIPEGWDEVSADDSNQYLQVQLVQQNMLGETFQFYAYDIWKDMDTARKIMNTRTSLDTTVQDTDITSLYKYLESFYNSTDSLESAQFGEIILLYDDEPTLLEHNDVQGNYYKKTYCMLKLGILYVFQYGYYEGSDLHEEEVNELLNSISISEPKTLAGDVEAYEEITNFTYAVVAVCVTVIVILVIITFLYIKSKKEAV